MSFLLGSTRAQKKNHKTSQRLAHRAKRVQLKINSKIGRKESIKNIQTGQIPRVDYPCALYRQGVPFLSERLSTATPSSLLAPLQHRLHRHSYSPRRGVNPEALHWREIEWVTLPTAARIATASLNKPLLVDLANQRHMLISFSPSLITFTGTIKELKD